MTRLTGLAVIFAVVVFVSAQHDLSAQSRFGFEATLGFSGAGGDFGDLMESGVPAEGIFSYQTGQVRLGFVANVGSYALVSPFEDQTWWKVGMGGAVGWVGSSTKIRPFVIGRLIRVTIKPEGEGFGRAGDSFPSFDKAKGWEGGVAAGAEYWVTPLFGFTASGVFTSFNTNDADLSDVGRSAISSGSTLGLRLGFVFTPLMMSR